MSIKEATYYQVHCDEPGCDWKTGDDGADYAAWAEPSQASDDWTDGDGVASLDGKWHYCAEHVQGRICADCGHVGPDLAEIDGEYLCDKCKPEATP